MTMHAHDYPDEPGHRGVATSIEAADSIRLITAPVRRAVLRALRDVGENGLTAEEASDRLGLLRTTAQPRLTELKLLGLARDSGQRRRNISKRRAIVWVAVRGEGHADG